MWRLAGAWVLLLFVASSVQASEADLETARRWVLEDLRYERAVKLLDRLLSGGTLREGERIQALRLLGIAYVAQGAEESAEAVFSELLTLDPNHRLDPLLSPKIHGVFERARTRVAQDPKIDDVLTITEGMQVLFQARLEDPTDRVAELVVFVRHRNETYRRLVMQAGSDRWSASFSLPPHEQARLEYYLEARDAAGVRVARYGAPDQPSQVMVERTLPPPPAPIVKVEPETDPWYGQWWLWTLAAVAVGATAVSVVVLTSSEPGVPPGTLDPIRLD